MEILYPAIVCFQLSTSQPCVTVSLSSTHYLIQAILPYPNTPQYYSHTTHPTFKPFINRLLTSPPHPSPTGSICQRNGYLFIYPRTAGVTWLSGQDSLKTYHFASKKMGHRFCPECGTSVCAWSDAPGFLDGLTAINVS